MIIAILPPRGMLIPYSFMALPSVQDRSGDGNESVSLERSETYPSNKLVLMLVPETSHNLSPNNP